MKPSLNIDPLPYAGHRPLKRIGSKTERSLHPANQLLQRPLLLLNLNLR